MMKLFDARVFVGPDRARQSYQTPANGDAIVRMLEKYGIARALVTSFHDANSLTRSNQITFQAAARDDRLVPCPVVIPGLPDETGDIDQQVAALIEQGARCVAYYPRSTNIIHHKLVHGRLFTTLAQRRLPMVVVVDEMSLEEIVDVLEAYPGLRVIYSGVNYRTARSLYPVMNAFRNLHVTICPPFYINQGIEAMIREVGVGQLLYGSDFPRSEPGASIAYLAYADITDDDKARIGFENLDRLTREVHL